MNTVHMLWVSLLQWIKKKQMIFHSSKSNDSSSWQENCEDKTNWTHQNFNSHFQVWWGESLPLAILCLDRGTVRWAQRTLHVSHSKWVCSCPQQRSRWTPPPTVLTKSRCIDPASLAAVLIVDPHWSHSPVENRAKTTGCFKAFQGVVGNWDYPSWQHNCEPISF